jgi:hypothetical protein
MLDLESMVATVVAPRSEAKMTSVRKYALWTDQDGAMRPSEIFDDRELAKAAAERLAASYPGMGVHLMATVEVCRKVAPVQWRKVG